MEKDTYANLNKKLKNGEISEREDRIIKFVAKKTITGKGCYNDKRGDPPEWHNYTKCEAQPTEPQHK